MKIGFSGELASVAATIVSAAVLCPFLRTTTDVVPRRGDTAEPVAAFVTLDADAEAAAVRAARSSWRASSGVQTSERARLSCDELPETREPEVLGDANRTRTGRPEDIGWTPPPLPPGMSAPFPPRDELPETAAPLPFSREEMLKLP